MAHFYLLLIIGLALSAIPVTIMLIYDLRKKPLQAAGMVLLFYGLFLGGCYFFTDVVHGDPWMLLLPMLLPFGIVGAKWWLRR